MQVNASSRMSCLKGIERKQFLSTSLLLNQPYSISYSSVFPLLSRDPSWRVNICTVVLSGTFPCSSYRHRIMICRSSMRASWHRQTRLPQSLLLSMTSVGSVRGARSGRSTRPSRLQLVRGKYPGRRQCDHRQLRRSCFAGRGSEGRVAVPFDGRMRKTRGAPGWGTLGGLGECGRPLQYICKPNDQASQFKECHTGRDAALAQKANHGLATLLQYLGCVHCGMKCAVGPRRSNLRFHEIED